jgi:tetratricopeptide (TPR) repeat protein
MSSITVTLPRRARAVCRDWKDAAALAVLLAALGCGGVESRMTDVRSLQEQGRFAESIELLDRVLAVQPDSAEANYRLGLALVQTGEPTRAVWPLQKAAEESGYEISAGVLLASTYFQTHNFDEAIRAADRVLAAEPDRQAALRIRASANLAARRLDAAYADTTRLVELYPDDYGARMLNATALGELGRLDEAEREHALLKQMGEQSRDPDFRNRACLAPAIFANDVLEDAAKAKALYEDCARRTPTDTVVLNHLVGYFESIGDSERGTRLWRDAVAAAPDKLELRQGLAARLQAVGQIDAAEKVLLDAGNDFDSVGAWNLLAAFYRARGEPNKALASIEKVVELSDDEDERARFVLADVLIDLGQFDRAREVADGLTRSDFAQLLRGRILLTRGDPAGALVEFEKGIRAWPNNASARFLAGLAARDLGDWDRAISELRAAVRSNNAETDASLELARIYLERGQYQQAVVFANQALHGRGGAQQPEPYAIAARALGALDQPERARRSIEALERRGFAGEALRERMALEARVGGPARGLAAAESSPLDLTIAEHIDVLQQWVDLAIEAKRPEAAVARIDAALERSPGSAPLLAMRGEALAAAGRRDEARAAFERAIEIDAAGSRAHAGLGALRASDGDAAGAITLFDRAYQLDPREGGYSYAAAQLVLASGDTDAARARLRQIVNRHPGISGARNDLAWLLAERGEQLDFALQLAQEAQRRDGSPALLDTLGWVHYQRGEYADAVKALEAALAASPDSPSIRYRLARALQQAGQPDRAREMLEAAVASGSFPEAEAARRQLSQLPAGG